MGAMDVLGITVLALLCERPRHPYEIQRDIRQRHLTFAADQPRAIYHAVDRLARARMVEPAETSREGRRPERTVYRVTEYGREELTARLLRLIERPLQDQPLYEVGLAFLAHLTPAACAEALEERAITLQAQVAGLRAVMPALRDQMLLPRLTLLRYELQDTMWQAELDWTRDLLRDLREGRLDWDEETLTRHFAQHRARILADAGGERQGEGPPVT
jgi:DNA-binding PadR family transcriptional regulator